MRSRSCRSRSGSMCRTTRSRRRAWRWAASRISRGATGQPKRGSTEPRRHRTTSSRQPRWFCATRADSDEKYKDQLAPEGSPYRPLYDDQVRFSGQPVALVVAEELEIARYAASLVRVDYEREAHETDFEAQARRGAVAKKEEKP